MKFPHLTLYVNKPPKGFDGFAFGPLIIIKKEEKNNKCLYLHEYEHVKQFYKSFGTMGIFYLLSKKKKAKYEAQAFAVQANCRPTSLDTYARFMSENYNLDMTKEECLAMIKKYM